MKRLLIYFTCETGDAKTTGSYIIDPSSIGLPKIGPIFSVHFVCKTEQNTSHGVV